MARKSRKPEALQAAAPVVTEVVYNTATYSRLSVVDSGKKDGESILNQQELLEQYIKQHPELDLKAAFVDNGESGVDFIRPGWNDLMRECRAGKINCIVIKDAYVKLRMLIFCYTFKVFYSVKASKHDIFNLPYVA